MIPAGKFVRDLPESVAISRAALLVAYALATYSDSAGHATISTPRLAASCRLHEGSVRRAIGELESLGIVSVQRTTGHPNRYRFPVQAPIELSTPARTHARGQISPTPRVTGSNPARTRAPLKTAIEGNTHMHINEPAAVEDGWIFLSGSGWIRRAQ